MSNQKINKRLKFFIIAYMFVVALGLGFIAVKFSCCSDKKNEVIEQLQKENEKLKIANKEVWKVNMRIIRKLKIK